MKRPNKQKTSQTEVYDILEILAHDPFICIVSNLIKVSISMYIKRYGKQDSRKEKCSWLLRYKYC